MRNRDWEIGETTDDFVVEGCFFNVEGSLMLLVVSIVMRFLVSREGLDFVSCCVTALRSELQSSVENGSCRLAELRVLPTTTCLGVRAESTSWKLKFS